MAASCSNRLSDHLIKWAITRYTTILYHYTYIFKIYHFSLLDQDLRKHSNGFGVIGLLYG